MTDLPGCGNFLELIGAASTLTPGFEEVFYKAWNGFTMQYPLILAAVTPVDDDETFQAKTRMVAGFIDLLVARRMVSFRNFGYNTVQYTMFNLIKDIRELDAGELAGMLGSRVADLEDDFSAVSRFRMHQRNGSHVKYLLARLTAWLEGQCGGTTTFADLIDRNRKDPFDIEHIWANHLEQHPEFRSEQDFADQRNKLGALLLLPRSFNASYGDKPYGEKLPHYYSHNLLARSLHPRCYENNPRFTQLSAERELPFEPHPTGFDVSAIQQRQSLYEALCTAIWDPARLPEGSLTHRRQQPSQRFMSDPGTAGTSGGSTHLTALFASHVSGKTTCSGAAKPTRRTIYPPTAAEPKLRRDSATLRR